MSLSDVGIRYITDTPKAMDCLIGRFESKSTDFQACTIHCLSGIVEKYEPQNEDLVKSIYNSACISMSTTDALFCQIQTSLRSLQHAAYSLLFALSKREWGVEAIIQCPGLPEYFMNRSLDSQKEGLQWKHLILSTIVSDDRFKNVLPRNLWHLIHQYVIQGVYHQDAQPATVVKDQFQ